LGALRRLLATLVFPLAAIAFLPAPVRAAEGENSLIAGVGFDRLLEPADGGGNGFGVLLGYRRGLADDWNLHATATYSAHFGGARRADLLSCAVEASYVIDAVTWVPEVHAGVGYFGPLARRVREPDLGLVAGIGVEYRRWREFGVGVRADYRFLVLHRDDTKGSMMVNAYVARYF
jgi:hypothetical protein